MSLFSFFQAFSFVVIFLKQNIFVSGFEQLSSFSTNVQKQSKHCNLFLREERPKPTKKGIAKNQNSSHQQAGTFFDCIFFCLSGATAVKNKTSKPAWLFSLRSFNFNTLNKQKSQHGLAVDYLDLRCLNWLWPLWRP